MGISPWTCAEQDSWWSSLPHPNLHLCKHPIWVPHAWDPSSWSLRQKQTKTPSKQAITSSTKIQSPKSTILTTWLFSSSSLKPCRWGRSSWRVYNLPLGTMGSSLRMGVNVMACFGIFFCFCSYPLQFVLSTRAWVNLLKPGFPGGSKGKESTCSAGDLDSVLGSSRSPGEGNGNLLQYYCLENPMNRGAWRAPVCRATESDMTEKLSIFL